MEIVAEKMQRHDVHLSAETGGAIRVGGRHGKPVVLTIRAGDMHPAGFVFRRFRAYPVFFSLRWHARDRMPGWISRNDEKSQRDS